MAILSEKREIGGGFGPFPPVENWLGPRPLQIIGTASKVGSFIVDRRRPEPPFQGICGYRILAYGPCLTTEQVRQLRHLLMLPEAYFAGRPIFKRLPSVPNFAFQFKVRDASLDLLVDLQNPGWEFH